MSKKCQLIMVTQGNNNKFYNMSEGADEIEVSYGRVGCKEMTATYPISKWDSLYNSKIKKGYQDISDLKVDRILQDEKEIEDKDIKQVVEYLIQKAKNKITNNYLVSYSEVSLKQVEQAQTVLDSLLEYKTKYVPVTTLNNRLLTLYTTIPRKMKNTKAHLLEGFDTKRIKEIIQEEQELLDVMKTQVVQNQATQTEAKQTILEKANIEMETVSAKELKLIKEKLGVNSSQLVKAFKVKQQPNESNFDNHVATCKNKTTELFWHGSRTENWWSILSTGLQIRPTGAVHTGSMFGDGLYFADKAQKSIGYTSAKGSYWANGTENNGFICLYEVHIGKQKTISKHTNSCYSFNKDNIKADSVFAKGGVDLKNNEYIVYNAHQCRPKYLVEIKGK